MEGFRSGGDEADDIRLADQVKENLRTRDADFTGQVKRKAGLVKQRMAGIVCGRAILNRSKRIKIGQLDRLGVAVKRIRFSDDGAQWTFPDQVVFKIRIFKFCVHRFNMRRERTDDCKIEFICRNFLDQIVQCIIIQKSELAALPGIFADKAGERPGGAAGTQGADPGG